MKKVNQKEKWTDLGNGKFIYRPEKLYTGPLNRMCGICQDILEDKDGCAKEECIAINSDHKAKSSKARCFNHGTYFSECLENLECKAAQNLKQMVSKWKKDE